MAIQNRANQDTGERSSMKILSENVTPVITPKDDYIKSSKNFSKSEKQNQDLIEVSGNSNQKENVKSIIQKRKVSKKGSLF